MRLVHLYTPLLYVKELVITILCVSICCGIYGWYLRFASSTKTLAELDQFGTLAAQWDSKTPSGYIWFFTFFHVSCLTEAREGVTQAGFDVSHVTDKSLKKLLFENSNTTKLLFGKIIDSAHHEVGIIVARQ